MEQTNITTKTILGGIAIGILGLGFGMDGFSYFQDTFHCALGSSTLQIATKEFQGSSLCLDLVRQLQGRKTEIISQLDQISTEPASAYNKSVKVTLIKQRIDIEKLIGQMISGVNNLELRLYNNYKKRYFSKLKPIRSKLITKQAVFNVDLAQSIGEGDIVLVTKIVRIIGFNYQRIKLIEGILASKSLDEMMPLLDTYEALIANQLQGKSE